MARGHQEGTVVLRTIFDTFQVEEDHGNPVVAAVRKVLDLVS